MTSDDNIIFLKGREIRLARGQTFTNEPWLKEPDDIQGWHNKCVCVCVSYEAPPYLPNSIRVPDAETSLTTTDRVSIMRRGIRGLKEKTSVSLT